MNNKLNLNHMNHININIKTITGFILIFLLFSPQNVISEGSYFNVVEQLSSDNKIPDVKELEALLNRYTTINEELNKKPSYDSSVVKHMMSESILNGIVFNLVHESDLSNTKQACNLLDSSKELFVDEMYGVYIMLKELGYSVSEVPMGASKSSFSSMGGYWKEGMRILRTKDFARQLKEYSENKKVVSLLDFISGKKDFKDMKFGWSDYKNRPEFSQYINTHTIYSHWAKYKIYCIYKKLEPQYATDKVKLYNSLVAEASSDPWLTGKKGILFNKYVWEDTINLNHAGGPKKFQTLRLVDAPEWK